MADVERRIQEAREGSREALGSLLESCRSYLWLVANERLEEAVRSKVSPADLVQQTFLEAARDFPQFQGDSEPDLLAWLRRILLNTLSNATRDLRAARRQVAREVPLGADLAGPAGEVAPDSLLIAEEERALLEQALDQIPADHRQVIQLRHRDGLTFAAIGQEMGRSAEAARKLWARAIESLQEILESHESP